MNNNKIIYCPIILCTGDGGVGKTSFSLNLTALLGQRGKKVAHMSFDPVRVAGEERIKEMSYALARSESKIAADIRGYKVFEKMHKMGLQEFIMFPDVYEELVAKSNFQLFSDSVEEYNTFHHSLFYPLRVDSYQGQDLQDGTDFSDIVRSQLNPGQNQIQKEHIMHILPATYKDTITKDLYEIKYLFEERSNVTDKRIIEEYAERRKRFNRLLDSVRTHCDYLIIDTGQGFDSPAFWFFAERAYQIFLMSNLSKAGYFLEEVNAGSRKSIALAYNEIIDQAIAQISMKRMQGDDSDDLDWAKIFNKIIILENMVTTHTTKEFLSPGNTHDVSYVDKTVNKEGQVEKIIKLSSDENIKDIYEGLKIIYKRLLKKGRIENITREKRGDKDIVYTRIEKRYGIDMGKTKKLVLQNGLDYLNKIFEGYNDLRLKFLLYSNQLANIEARKSLWTIDILNITNISEALLYNHRLLSEIVDNLIIRNENFVYFPKRIEEGILNKKVRFE